MEENENLLWLRAFFFIFEFSLGWRQTRCNDSIDFLRNLRRVWDRLMIQTCRIHNCPPNGIRFPAACRKLAQWMCVLRRIVRCSDRVHRGRGLLTHSKCRRKLRGKSPHARRLTTSKVFGISRRLSRLFRTENYHGIQLWRIQAVYFHSVDWVFWSDRPVENVRLPSLIARSHGNRPEVIWQSLLNSPECSETTHHRDRWKYVLWHLW